MYIYILTCHRYLLRYSFTFKVLEYFVHKCQLAIIFQSCLMYTIELLTINVYLKQCYSIFNHMSDYRDASWG